MIAMLRRRLMSNMAKAKNIATGTFSDTNKNQHTLTVQTVGFKPDHVIFTIISGSGNASRLVSFFDGAVASASSGDMNFIKTSRYDYQYNDNGFTMNAGADSMNGTYRYVAWQE